MCKHAQEMICFLKIGKDAPLLRRCAVDQTQRLFNRATTVARQPATGSAIHPG
jgi:hypothetical protein